MTAQRKFDLPAEVRSEMARLVSIRRTILPLGGADRKSPLLANWATQSPSLSQCLAIMSRTQSLAFGLRLDHLVVLDFDIDEPTLIARIEARFGPSPVHVKTPRGWHLYYATGGVLPSLKSEGLPVDVKSGPRAYVVAAPSVRPDGGKYAYAKGCLGVGYLPPLRALQEPPASPLRSSTAMVSVGERHSRLVKEARAMVEFVDDKSELIGNLIAFRDNHLCQPETMLTKEVRDIAEYFWKLRLEGRLSKGRNSWFQLHRLSIDALGNAPNRSDALALYVTLVDLHAHTPGKRFPLVWKAMREKKRTDLSRRRFDAARRTLLELGLICLVGKHRAGSRPRIYTLQRIRPGMADAGNVTPLLSA